MKKSDAINKENDYRNRKKEKKRRLTKKAKIIEYQEKYSPPQEIKKEMNYSTD